MVLVRSPRASASALALTFLLAAFVARADDGVPPATALASVQEVAQALHDGRIDAAEAARTWAEAGATVGDAHAALGRVRLLEAPPGDHEVALVDEVGRRSTAHIVVPPEGPGPDGRYRVLVLLHGIGGDADQSLRHSEGLIPPHTLLVAPSAVPVPDELEFEDMRGTAAIAMNVNRLFPSWWSYRPSAFPLQALDHVLRRYPIDRDRVVLAGYSMGGFGAWNLGLRYHDRFAALAPLAGGISREEYLLAPDPLSRALLDNAAMVPCFFVHGSRDEVVPVAFDRWTARDLKARGVEHTYVEVKGGRHILTDFVDAQGSLKQRLKDWVVERARDPHPRRVVHRVVGDYHGSAYWLRIEGHEGNTARAVAQVVDPSRIEVETRGVRRLTVFLDPTLVDAAQPLTVVVDGEVIHEGPVAESLEALAGSYARTADPALTYARALTLDVTPREVETLGGPLDRWLGRSEPRPGGRRPDRREF